MLEKTGVTLVTEPLNTRVDHRGCPKTEQGVFFS
jgi:hypothetical protein